MRVVAGELRGRRIAAPRSLDTRPTTDRVREAIGSALEAAGVIEDAVVFDAFAGSGALGIEALSRGAAYAVFVERDRAALAVLRENLESLGLKERSSVIATDVFSRRCLDALAGRGVSLLFLDPPYRIDKSEVRGLIGTLLDSGGLAPGATIVWESGPGEAVEWPSAVIPVSVKRYGDTMVSTGTIEGGGEE